jgi:hypothetical protein
MTPETQILLSGALTFGVPLALAARELIALRRPPRGGGPPTRTPAAPPLKPLPGCLVPRPPVRRRVLEDA